jgi:hypothetical protein
MLDAHNIFSNQNKIHDIQIYRNNKFTLKLYPISDMFLQAIFFGKQSIILSTLLLITLQLR